MANPHAPVGFRFRPSDQEIIRFFLYTMVVKREPLMLLYNNFVHVEDLFSDKEPRETWEDYGGDQLCDDEGSQKKYKPSDGVHRGVRGKSL
ncbi:NAC domain-containing protein 100-like [Pyrus ussuriensis x Pyrus communis]|uniref:NAC domain-containing protein 100-like n=1 Tax=Pyrus ussuriensis x Pyrus communis TaxID=2448454 RepID=A0A5N5HGC0_9ROSA|nr:NAC domain-containing protein 100-like [Pyrus ussuriensis x Pyrus communis]